MSKRRISKFFEPLMTVSLPLMKNALTPLTKRVLIQLGLTAATSVSDVAIQNNIFGSGTTALIISIEEVE